jgi:hypothetical protein
MGGCVRRIHPGVGAVAVTGWAVACARAEAMSESMLIENGGRRGQSCRKSLTRPASPLCEVRCGGGGRQMWGTGAQSLVIVDRLALAEKLSSVTWRLGASRKMHENTSALLPTAELTVLSEDLVDAELQSNVGRRAE